MKRLQTVSGANVISGKTSTEKHPLVCQMESGLTENSWWGWVGSGEENAVHSGMNRRRKQGGCTSKSLRKQWREIWP